MSRKSIATCSQRPNKSSRSQIFFKIGVLRISKYLQESTCVGVSFECKVASQSDSNTGLFL